MSTPIEPRDDEPIEETLRPHLWRLRARLVTPPEEARVAADLDRLHRAAREHAHQVGSEPEVVALPTTAAVAAPWTRIGQVAAALLLAVAVGAGLTVLTDGEVADPGLATPEGEDSSQQATSADDAAGSESLDLEVAAPDNGLTDAGSGQGATDQSANGSEPAVSDSDADPDADTAADAGAGPGSSSDPASGAGTPPDAGSSGGPGAGGVAPAPVAPSDDAAPADEGPAGEQPAQEAPAGDSPANDAPSEPPAGEEIIAAPDPGALDGFGGERPCPDGIESDDCLVPDPSPVDDEDGAASPEPEQPESPSQPTTPTED